jgi:hypothetical protein
LRSKEISPKRNINRKLKAKRWRWKAQTNN